MPELGRLEVLRGIEHLLLPCRLKEALTTAVGAELEPSSLTALSTSVNFVLPVTEGTTAFQRMPAWSRA